MDDDGKYMLCRPSANKHCRRLSLRPTNLHCTSPILWRDWRWIRNVPNTKCNTQNNEEKRRGGAKVTPMTPKTVKKKGEKGEKVVPISLFLAPQRHYCNMRRLQYEKIAIWDDCNMGRLQYEKIAIWKRLQCEKIARFYSFLASQRHSSSSQVKVRAIWSDPMNLAKNKSLALNLLNQLTTESWEWHPQQNICCISLGCLLSQQFRLYRNLLC